MPAAASIRTSIIVLLTAMFTLVPAALFAALQGDPPVRLTLARVHYQGGGDWYNGPTEIPNLLDKRLIERRMTVTVNVHPP